MFRAMTWRGLHILKTAIEVPPYKKGVRVTKGGAVPVLPGAPFGPFAVWFISVPLINHVRETRKPNLFITLGFWGTEKNVSRFVLLSV